MKKSNGMNVSLICSMICFFHPLSSLVLSVSLLDVTEFISINSQEALSSDKTCQRPMFLFLGVKDVLVVLIISCIYAVLHN